MQAPDIPVSEETRLDTLRSMQILDSRNEERFDRITRVACRMFQVPIALVSLVDEDRQWFKSNVGMDAHETPRDVSFCGHAILGDDTFYVPDAASDERFRDNPLVTGPSKIRFYVGQPLVAPNGEKLGTLCLLDREPRLFDDEDITALKSLAKMVEGELAAVYMATMDDLTGISNRRGLDILAMQALSFSGRRDFPVSCVYFDLNKFKHINDQFGHQEGDRALRVFAEQLKTTFRDSDVVARVGGDEFVALLNDSDMAFAQNIVDRFASELAEKCSDLDLPYDIHFAYGIAQYDKDKHKDVSGLMSDADHSMYKDKQDRDAG